MPDTDDPTPRLPSREEAEALQRRFADARRDLRAPVGGQGLTRALRGEELELDDASRG